MLIVLNLVNLLNLYQLKKTKQKNQPNSILLKFGSWVTYSIKTNKRFKF